MSKNFIDRFYEEDDKDRFWSLNKKIGAGFVVLFLTIVMLNTTGCTKGNSDNSNVPDTPIQAPAESVNVDGKADNAAIAPDDTVDTLTQEKNKDEGKNSLISMSIEDMGRSDPFLPDSEKVVVKPKPKFVSDLTPPPEALSVDATATQVMTTKISGIMYDKFNPSAILNIGGSDYLVRSGDIVNGYKILSIEKNTVTVQFGANVYKASVGELFTGEGINYNTVSNLQDKFGSSSNSANKH